MLTVSNEYMEKIRGVETLKLPRAYLETSHCQDKEYCIENEA
jgi:hypothetical protein